MKNRGIQLGRNEPCPCGSGKRYMDCCLNTKYLMNYNYEGKAVMVDKNSNLENLKKILNFNRSLTKLKESKDTLSIDHGLNSLGKTYGILDKGIKDIIKFTPCKKGCSYCCHAKFEITKIEAEHIKRYIENYMDDNIIAKLKNNFNNSDSNQCVFLTDMGECIVYKARPVKCRTHFVFSNPKGCKADTSDKPLIYTDAILSLVENTVEKISGLITKDINEPATQPMMYWFMDDFKMNNTE